MPTPQEIADDLGHVLVNDPPHELTRFGRETCEFCGRAIIIRPNGTAYGSALEDRCDLGVTRPQGET